MVLRFIVLVNLVVSASASEGRLSRLEVGDATYTNVLVLSVSATDMYFTHDGGFANVKLATVEPAIQKRFHFDPEKASTQEARQRQDNALYMQMLTNAPQTKAPPELEITAEASQPAIEYEYYKINGPKPPQVPSGMIASTTRNFECSPEFTWLPTPTKMGEGFTWRLLAVNLKMSLPIKITLPEGVTSKVRAHEEGHRKINEHYYAIGTRFASQLAESLKTRDFYSSNGKLEIAKEQIERPAAKIIEALYWLYVRNPAKRANEYFDELTSHGSNNMDPDEAVKQAIARY